MSETTSPVCIGCGLTVLDGAEGCLRLYREVIGLGFGHSAHPAGDRLAWDTYCVQHPNRYCASAKSLAAHLGGLCWALEYGGHATGYRALNRFLDGPARFPKPALPAFRGALTIGDVGEAGDAATRACALERWARATWEAYADLQPLARRWIEEALAKR